MYTEKKNFQQHVMAQYWNVTVIIIWKVPHTAAQCAFICVTSNFQAVKIIFLYIRLFYDPNDPKLTTDKLYEANIFLVYWKKWQL